MKGTKGKVLVAMSGGVDSSVAAALLLREGYEVVGCFMRLGSPEETLEELVQVGEACERAARQGQDREDGEEKNGSENRGTREENGSENRGARSPRLKIGHQGCCSINDAADARLVAAELGIPFYVCNFKKDFGRIIDYFVDEYASGRTPNPCVRCNDWLKFGKLHEYAGQVGAGFVASGHYARIGASRRQGVEASRVRDDAPSTPGRLDCSPCLMRGVDHSKDQSYVLFGMPRGQLAHTLFPIGNLPKTEVRALAKRFGLPVFDKPDSQEICFVPDNDYAGLVERRRPGSARPGRVVDEQGRELGSHEGQHRFTIGQRRGLSVALGHPVFVVGKDAASNTVTVGPRDRLAVKSCEAGEANWLVDVPAGDGGMRVLAKYRYNTPAAPACVRVLSDGRAATPSGRVGRFTVVFDSAQDAVAPGQAVVLYSADEPDLVLGGGWIASAARK